MLLSQLFSSFGQNQLILFLYFPYIIVEVSLHQNYNFKGERHQMDILAPYLPTIVLVVIAAFMIGADLIKSKNVYREERNRQRQEIIDEHEEQCSIQDEFNALHEKLDLLSIVLENMSNRMENAESRLDDLTKSDMHDTKGWIVDQYQKYFVEQGWIDAFHAEIIDRRYEDYVKEGGNSYIETLMNRLHSLPMDPPADQKKKK
jgi:hypothetical protein